MLRDAQLRVVRWAVDAALASGRPTDPPARELGDAAHEALSRTGLGPFVAGLVDEHRLRLPSGELAQVGELRRSVEAARPQFVELLRHVLGVLAGAGVPVAPVRGPVLADQVWRRPDERPMTDIDLLVPRDVLDRAADALVAGGFAHCRTAWTKHALVVPAGGAAGRADAAGPDMDAGLAAGIVVELHPAWVEQLHGYAIDDRGTLLRTAGAASYLGAPCLMLPPAGLVVQCLGHLSASVIRRDVRGVNVLDVVLGLRSLDLEGRAALGRQIDQLDARFSAPGLWLIEQVRQGAAVHQDIDVGATLARLPGRARDQLLGLDPAAVLSGPPGPARWRWRAAWPVTGAERTRMTWDFLRRRAGPGGA